MLCNVPAAEPTDTKTLNLPAAKKGAATKGILPKMCVNNSWNIKALRYNLGQCNLPKIILPKLSLFNIFFNIK